MTIKELKKSAKTKMKSNWGKIIIACLVGNVISSMLAATNLGITLFGILNSCYASWFLAFCRTKNTSLESLKNINDNLFQKFLSIFLLIIYIFLWSLLFIIPGIIKTLSYSMTFYILADDNSINANMAIKRSKIMMKGYKFKLFCLYLSFLGWGILSVFTLGLGFIFLIPYIYVTLTEFYLDISKKNEEEILN